MNTIITLIADMGRGEPVNDVNLGFAGALVVFLIFMVIIVSVIVVFILWVIALVHLIQNEDIKDRILWLVLLFAVGGIIGPVYYFAVKKPYDAALKATQKKSKLKKK